MRFISILLFIILLISCKEKTSGNIEKITPDSSKVVSGTISDKHDSLTWIQNFREFRDAIYQRNKTKAKTFFDFPVMNENNEIWYLVYEQGEKQIARLPGKIKPFTESDFDRYFDRLFSKYFIKSILKIKSEELNKKLEIETIELKDGNTSYKMYVTVDNVKKTLTLNLSSDTVIKDEYGEVQDGGEFNIIYTFDIIENRQLKFKEVRLAG